MSIKSSSLDMVRIAAAEMAEHHRSTGKSPEAIDKFEAGMAELIAKGELLDDAFFAALPWDRSATTMQQGSRIARVINDATKES